MKTLEQQLADAHAERDEALASAAESARIAEEASRLLASATAHIVASKSEPAPAAPPPPPVPAAAPRPPRPTFREFCNASSFEKKRLREIHGAGLEDELGEAFEHENRMVNVRGAQPEGFVIRPAGGGGHIQAGYTPGPTGLDEGWRAGAPKEMRWTDPPPPTPAEQAETDYRRKNAAALAAAMTGR